MIKHPGDILGRISVTQAHDHTQLMHAHTVRMHARMHTRMRTHTHTHTYTHTHMHSCTHARTHALILLTETNSRILHHYPTNA